jgi:hypothetical protein
MQSVNFYDCSNLTGTADLEDGGHIYLIRFGGQPQHVLIPHFLFFRLFAFPPAGAVDKMVLPEDMQSVNFDGCECLTGTVDCRG